jgi:hypothetical protein
MRLTPALAVLAACTGTASTDAAPGDVATQADVDALVDRVEALEAQAATAAPRLDAVESAVADGVGGEIVGEYDCATLPADADPRGFFTGIEVKPDGDLYAKWSAGPDRREWGFQLLGGDLGEIYLSCESQGTEGAVYRVVRY